MFVEFSKRYEEFFTVSICMCIITFITKTQPKILRLKIVCSHAVWNQSVLMQNQSDESLVLDRFCKAAVGKRRV